MPPAAAPPRAGRRWLIGAVLFLAVVAVFGKAVTFSFVDYDDNEYVFENDQVKAGLTWPGAVWAFTHVHSANWHPLTWLSHMGDWQVFGDRAGGHHATSVLIHAVTAVLLFLALARMTGAVWPSALVAALFALHPQRVESVAWVAERKDVLSGLFFVATLWAYARYVERCSLPRYAAVVAALACGLMAKPMLVTTPFVLLLLDYWPLGRLQGEPPRGCSLRRAIVEKIPLLVLAAGSCAITMFAQEKAIRAFPFPLRLGNAVVSYAAYLVQMIFPARLSVLYPYPEGSIPGWQLAGAAVVLAAITAAAVVLRRSHRFLPVGWFWYLGMMVPVIGLLQVGCQARADRYTYLPEIGLYIVLAWGLAGAARGWPALAGAVGGAAVAGCAAATFFHVDSFRDDEALWTTALRHTSRNVTVHYNFGTFLAEKGRLDEARWHLDQALRIDPTFAEAAFELGSVLQRQGRAADAVPSFELALALDPNYAEAHNNLGMALKQLGRLDEAVRHFRRTIELKPGLDSAYNSLGTALCKMQDLAEGIEHYRRAVEINPRNAEAFNNLGFALLQQGKPAEAIPPLSEAVRIAPTMATAHRHLGNALRQAGRLDEALVHYSKAAQSAPDDADAAILDDLAAAYAEAGQFAKAVEVAEDAAKRASATGQAALAEEVQARIKLYRAKRPVGDPQGASAAPAPPPP